MRVQPKLASCSTNTIAERKKRKRNHSIMSDSLQPHGLKLTRLLHPWDFPDKNTGVVCHFLLQGIFPSQGLNLGLLHSRQILYQLSYQGMPSIHFILCCPFSSCPQPFSASGSFRMSRLFASGGQRIGASASVSVLPMNIQG